MSGPSRWWADRTLRTEGLSAYHLHANAYITKPVDLDRFIDVVTGIGGFWLTIARLPPG